MEKIPAIINLNEVSKTFDNGTIAVQGMSIDVLKGQFISFLGPSGCGKSTVLKMISGLLKPTKGEIVFNNCGFGSEEISVDYMQIYCI